MLPFFFERLRVMSMDYGWLCFGILLASWLGVELITKVPSQLHTPLMSGTNAISGITLIGALVALARAHDSVTEVLSYIGIFLAVINVFGGYWVTDRMLKMFNSKNNQK